ncbi:hypothetical protein [Polaromonas sp. YR568]|uniref:hypothetical protein n=1 Tax=Polaromonas sp. YR568 TaxID=1855301 RepID=UPI0031379E74
MNPGIMVIAPDVRVTLNGTEVRIRRHPGNGQVWWLEFSGAGASGRIELEGVHLDALGAAMRSAASFPFAPAS